MMVALAFALAAGFAALVRAHLGQLGWRGTLVANLTGALLLGWLVASEPSGDVATVIGVGFCGTLTTMSTFALDATGVSRRQTALVVASTVGGGLIAVSIGHALT